MNVGATLGVELHHVEDPISLSTPCGFSPQTLALVTSVIVKTISLKFETIAWFP
jgi:hypothetical protein